jgi:hypothetical protein
MEEEEEVVEEVLFKPKDPCRSHYFQSHRGRSEPFRLVHLSCSGGVRCSGSFSAGCADEFER